MHCPKLTPLQSRFAACLGTSVLLLLIYLSLSPAKNFAYAAEVDSIHNQDHNHHRIPHEQGLDIGWGDSDGDSTVSFETAAELEGTADYQADFPGVSRQFIGRALADQWALPNNVPNALNVLPGETKYYVFENSSVWGDHAGWRAGLPANLSRADGEIIWKRNIIATDRVVGERLEKRQNGDGTFRTVYISINTCVQPTSNETDKTAPQLTLYVSTSDGNQKPGPDKSDASQSKYPLTEGFVEAKINATSNVYISVAAPKLSGDFTGPWNYVVAASIDASYYYYNDTTPFIWTIDTDTTSALVATYNLTDQAPNVTDQTAALRAQWMNATPPFTMFVYNSSTPLVNGVRNSYCGLQKLDLGNMFVESTMTERGMGSNPKQQFHVQGLQGGQKYTGVLAYNGINSSGTGVVGGGGQLWQAMEFTTKTDGNCRVIYNLPFCTDVAYAVPTNPLNETLNSVQTLSQLYDNRTASMYQNFTHSLDQIPCHTTNSAQYSLASNCTHCARDYKTWLCAVTIPRCEDFSTQEDYLVPRNLGQPFANNTRLDPSLLPPSNLTQLLNTSTLPSYSQTSRNPFIDEVIRPGPYKELLPCKELCFDLVRSCPMALGFVCPNSRYMGMSYGSFDAGSIAKEGDGAVTCNYLGVDWPSLSAGPSLSPNYALILALGIMAFMAIGA